MKGDEEKEVTTNDLAIMMAKGFERVDNRFDTLETKIDRLEIKVDNLELGQEGIRNVLIGNQERRMEMIEKDNRVIKNAFEKHLGVII